MTVSRAQAWIDQAYNEKHNHPKSTSRAVLCLACHETSLYLETINPLTKCPICGADKPTPHYDIPSGSSNYHMRIPERFLRYVVEHPGHESYRFVSSGGNVLIVQLVPGTNNYDFFWNPED